MPQTILVLDFGSQYTQVIARRIREQNVYSQVLPFDTPFRSIKKINPVGVILSGGPASVLSKGAPLPDKKIFSLGVPVLGICYGLQLMGKLLGGVVKKCELREYGRSQLTVKKAGKLFSGLPKNLTVWNSHGDALTEIPKGFRGIASTENSDFSAIEDATRKFYGLQFHPEVEHSQNGVEVLNNFLFTICKCKADWDMGDFIESSVKHIQDQVGNKKVILGLSGGVDSCVAAALIDRAIGDQLISIFVDNGLLRLNEREEVIKLFHEHIPGKLKVAKAGKLFLGKLKGVTDPERKRKIIGKTFIEVFDNEVKKLGKVDFLAQGTLYPDVIESVPIGGNPAALIKSHHNVGGLPEKMRLKLLEPLRELFKDEVRLLGKKLGLPDHVINRHPFPGPGLGVRVIGDLTPKRLKVLRQADAIFISELRNSGWYSKLWQAFCVFLPVRSVELWGTKEPMKM